MRRELAYSVATLIAELDGDASAHRDLHRSAAGLHWLATSHRRHFRSPRVDDVESARASIPIGAKPAALVEALRLFRADCVLLDADTCVRPGFVAAVDRALAAGAAMNAFVRANPYPSFGPFETDLPHVGRYRFNSARAPMLNSGLVAARARASAADRGRARADGPLLGGQAANATTSSSS